MLTFKLGFGEIGLWWGLLTGITATGVPALKFPKDCAHEDHGHTLVKAACFPATPRQWPYSWLIKLSG
jgi:hypothetical protein